MTQGIQVLKELVGSWAREEPKSEAYSSLMQQLSLFRASQFKLWGLRKVTQVKFSWVQAVYNPKDKLHMAKKKPMFSIEAYKQITISSYN